MGSEDFEFDALCKSYGEVAALRNLSFVVHPGEIFGFVGGNGAGKTTAMRIALGVLDADGGEVRWKGRPVDLSTWRRIGYMPEERGLYAKMKVREQLVYLAELHGVPNNVAHRSVVSWAERLNIAHRLDDQLEKLSLGNQQRVQLAAALVHQPDVLILDEPFSGLDPVAVDVMSAVLKDERDRGVPVLFSSHQLDLVQRLCDRVGIVNNGEIAAMGTVDELRSGDDVRLVVDVPDAPEGWADEIVGVSNADIDRQTGATVIQLSPGADTQLVLSTAMQHGTVREFTLRRPSLTDRFRDVVSDTDSTREAEAGAQQPGSVR